MGKIRRRRKYSSFSKKTRCRFCRENIKTIDYKDVAILQKLLTTQGKLFSKKRSGNCARHQRLVKTAVKRARFMALLPFVG
jgi:small subunit ribosomal protein S18